MPPYCILDQFSSQCKSVLYDTDKTNAYPHVQIKKNTLPIFKFLELPLHRLMIFGNFSSVLERLNSVTVLVKAMYCFTSKLEVRSSINVWVKFIYYPPEVRRGEYWGLEVFLLQYFPLVNI